MAVVFSENPLFMLNNQKIELCLEEHVNEKNKQKLLVTGKSGSGKSEFAAAYAVRNENAYDYIFHIVFDKEKYLFIDKETALSVDRILKKAIIRTVAASRGCLESDALDFFEKCLDENTLVVIDNYDIKALSPYMRHIACKDCGIVLVSRENIDVSDYGFGHIRMNDKTADYKEQLDKKCRSLDTEQTELLMSLSAMLFYLGDDTHIVSSSSGVFDRESVGFYLGGLMGGLDGLVENEFVKQAEDGRLYIERYVSEYVFSQLKPTTDNCKTLMSCFEKLTDFTIDQSIKNIYGAIYTEFDDNCVFSSADELLELYTYFAKDDIYCAGKIYNMLMSAVINNISSVGVCGYYHHLTTRNMSYFLSLMCKNADDAFKEKLYSFGDEDEFCECSISFSLDILRICSLLLRNMTNELYNANKGVMTVMLSELKSLLCKISNCSDETDVIDDVIRICGECFCNFKVVERNGKYNGFRDKTCMQISYTCDKFSDDESALGLDMGFSRLTLSLYGMYQLYLGRWIDLQQKCNPENEELSAERKELFESISVSACRIIDGYDSFSDFFEKSKRNVIVNDILDDVNETRLSRNKHLVKRGYDGGTSAGAKRYAEKVMSAVRGSKEPLGLVNIVLCRDYNVSDEFYKFLFENGFVKLVVNNKHISNHSKQDLVLNLIDCYNEVFVKEHKKHLYRELTSMLLMNVTTTEMFETKLFHVVNSMYFENKTNSLNNDSGFVDSLYKKYCMNKNFSETNADDYIATAVYDYLSFGKCGSDKKGLCTAFKCACFEYLTDESDFDIKGFFGLCVSLCGFEEAKKIFDEAEKHLKCKEFTYSDFLKVKQT